MWAGEGAGRMPSHFLGREAAVKGSDKTFGKWFGANWIWLAVVGVMLAGVGGLGYKIFSTYAEQLPYISNDHTAWASFGSLLAGFFTLTGTVATVATLLFLAHQNKGMQKVTQAQLDTMTFERYINHRKLFIEQLHETISVHKGTFRFRDPNHLYNSIFTENSPHHCVFSVAPEYDPSGNAINHIAKMLNNFERIKYFLNGKKFEDGESFDLVMALNNLSEYIFMIEPVGDVRDGDVIFNGENLGFNIFSIEDLLSPCLTMVNVILKFTNNELIDVSLYQSKSRYLREMLVNDLLLAEDNGVVEVRKSIKGIGLLALSYYKAQDIYEEYDFVFPATVQALRDVFDSAVSVNDMKNDIKFNAVLDVCLNEVGQKITSMDERAENREASLSLNNILVSLISRKGFV